MICPRRHTCWQSKRLYWKKYPDPHPSAPQRAVGSGNPGELLCHMAHSLRHYGDGGLLSRLSLANYSDSGVLLGGAHVARSRGCQGEGFWEMIGHVVFPLDLSWTLLIGGGLLVPVLYLDLLLSWNYSCKYLLWCLAKVGDFSQCAFPNREIEQTGSHEQNYTAF